MEHAVDALEQLVEVGGQEIGLEHEVELARVLALLRSGS